VPDTENKEKRQAELLSAAIDSLNQGLPFDDSQEDEEFAELLSTVSLIKTAAPLAPPPAVLQHIVEESAQAIAREKRKKRLQRVWAGCTGVAAAAAVAAFLYIMPPTTQELQLAKQPQPVPSPTVEPPQPAAIAPAPPNLTEPSAAPAEKPAPVVDAKVVMQDETLPGEPQPSVALGLPTPTTPAKTETMLALADRKADSVTIDSVSNIIRQIYRKGAPDEIILTQAPKRAEVLQSTEPTLPGIQAKRAVVKETVDMKIKAPDRNKVTVTVGDKEVTLEGALSREELLKLAATLTDVNIAQ